MSVARRLLLAGILGVAWPTTAAADPCRDPHGAVRAPILLGAGPAGFAGFAPTCVEHRLGVDGRATLDGSTVRETTGVLSGTYRVSERGFLAGSFDFVRTADGQPTRFGPPVLGGHFVVARGADTQLTMFMRVLFPLEAGSDHLTRVGTESGLSLLHVPTARLALHGTVSMPVLWTFVGEQGTGLVRPRVTVDGELSLFEHLTVLAGLEVRAVNAPTRLDAVVARGALRFPLGANAELHVEAAAPFAGEGGKDRQVALGGAARF